MYAAAAARNVPCLNESIWIKIVRFKNEDDEENKNKNDTSNWLLLLQLLAFATCDLLWCNHCLGDFIYYVLFSFEHCLYFHVLFFLLFFGCVLICLTNGLNCTYLIMQKSTDSGWIMWESWCRVQFQLPSLYYLIERIALSK